MARYAIGIDLGGTKVEACLVDENRKILARKRRPSEPELGRERVVANILDLVAETASALDLSGAEVGAVRVGRRVAGPAPVEERSKSWECPAILERAAAMRARALAQAAQAARAPGPAPGSGLAGHI